MQLQDLLLQYKLADAEKLAKQLAKQLASINKQAEQLEYVQNAKMHLKSVSIADLQAIDASVANKLASLKSQWGSTNWLKLAEKCDWEAYEFLGKNMKGVQDKFPDTWQISQKAYIVLGQKLKQEPVWQSLQAKVAHLQTAAASHGKAASLEGVDISSYSGDIDWKKVKTSGIDFVMVRLGGRGYGEKGEIYKDDRALEYIKGAQAQGIKAGGYFFSQATTTNEAIEEADYVKEILGDTKLDFPVAYDWEIIKDEEARTDKVTPAQATECARAFCQEAASYGYTPMIYSTSRELYFKYDLTKLANYDIWYCEYANTPEFYYQFSMWQYSETGKVDGIEGNVDLNICFTGVAKYAE